MALQLHSQLRDVHLQSQVSGEQRPNSGQSPAPFHVNGRLAMVHGLEDLELVTTLGAILFVPTSTSSLALCLMDSAVH